MMLLGLGIGFFLLDFGTDLNFSADMNQMSSINTTKYEGCRNETEELELKKEFNEMTCFGSDRRESFKCLDFLNKFQQKARSCFNREQHFDSGNLKQFTYMRINLILTFRSIRIYLNFNLIFLYVLYPIPNVPTKFFARFFEPIETN